MMSLLLMASLLAAPPDGAGAAYPLFPVLEEAREACAAATTFAAVDPPAAGWVKFEPEPGGWLSEYMQSVRTDRGRYGRYGVILPLRHSFDAFRKNEAGRPLILLRTRVANRKRTIMVSVCEVFDRDAQVSADAQALHVWGGGAPDDMDRSDSGRIAAIWGRPFGAEGVLYVPATEPVEINPHRRGLIYVRMNDVIIANSGESP